MNLSLEEMKQKLIKKGIKLSHQRLKVLEYLIMNQDHPTVDKIYCDLHKEIITLSKTTVYNTLKLLVDTGIVKELTIDDVENRYDIITESHGHFMCNSCGKIFNFNINIEVVDFGGLENFSVKEKNVYFKGLCSVCLLNINNAKED